MCLGIQGVSTSRPLGSGYSGSSAGIRVKQEPGLSAESIERLEKRRRVVQQTLSSDLVSGDGFLVSSRDNPMVPAFQPSGEQWWSDHVLCQLALSHQVLSVLPHHLLHILLNCSPRENVYLQ